MNLNKETIDLIKGFEGLELKAYKDSVGVWTIGYGHTTAAGNPAVVSGLTITNQQAEDMLRSDLRKYQAMVDRNVKVPLNENQYGALVSFTYNLGEGNLKYSTLLKKVNAKDFKGAALEFAKWNKAGGAVLKGLTRRRAAEAALFSKSTLSAPQSPIQPVPEVPAVPQPPLDHVPVQAPVKPTGLLALILGIITAIFGRKK